MNFQKLLLQMTGLILVMIFLAACGMYQPSSTPISPAATSLPPTTAPLPPTPTPVLPISPSARGYHRMAYDVESDRVILFGGSTNPDSGMLIDTWTYNPSTDLWRKMSPAQSPREGADGSSLAYDIQSDRAIMFVGVFFHGTNKTPPAESASETWAYDSNTDTWENMEPTKAPFGILGHRMVYDVESDRMILFGGMDHEVLLNDGMVEYVNDTWAYDFDSNAWTKMEPTTSPPGRNQHAMVYDNSSDRVILFGDKHDDMWSYDYNTDTWKELEPDKMPSPRIYCDMIYDAGSDKVILFGGASVADETALYDTWSYHYDTNIWTQLEPDTYPSARGWYAAVFSNKAARVILFGGGENRWTFTDETWSYAPETNIWMNITPSR